MLLWSLAIATALLACVYAAAALGPLGFRAVYRREGQSRLAMARGDDVPVTTADLAGLPDPVRRYLSYVGVVGQPRVRHFTASGRGRIRQRADDPWMPFTFRQHNFVDEPARFFFMAARRGGLPVDVFHTFQGGTATMRVRLLSLLPMVSASGPEMTRAETVTLLNDLCVLAPATLVDPAIEWEPVDDRTARARYTVGPNTVAAELEFGEDGALLDFLSDDRLQSTGGGRFERVRWSTPLSDYRLFGPLRLAARGEGRWHPPESAFNYIELELLDIRMNPSALLSGLPADPGNRSPCAACRRSG